MRFQTMIFSTGTADCRSISHHGASEMAVWVTDFARKSPFVFPSMASSAGPLKSVVLCEALPLEAMFRPCEMT